MSISTNLRLTGDGLIPEEITSLVGVAPVISRRKGDSRISSSEKEIVAKFGLWTWKISDLEAPLGINQQIELLGVTFKNPTASLANLPNVENAWIDICVVSEAEAEQSAAVEILLDANSVATLHRLGLPVEFTFYPQLRKEPDPEYAE